MLSFKNILILSNLFLILCLICEDIERPRKKEDCFKRNFVGEFNVSNAYCCFLKFNKNNWKILKCSVHFKDEIDNNAVFSTINFLKSVNSQTSSSSEVSGVSLDCLNNYIKNRYLFLLLFFIFIYN